MAVGDARASAAAGRPAALNAAAIAEFLGATALFRACGSAVITQIAPHIEARDFRASEVIVRAGTPEPMLGVIQRGRAVVRRVHVGTGQSTAIQELAVGDSFGEVGALLGTAQTHEVVAEEDVTVLLVGRNLISQLAEKVVGFAHALARRLATQLVQASVAQLRAATPNPIMTDPGSVTGVVSAPTVRAAAPADAGDVIPFVSVARYPLDDQTMSLIPARLIQQHRVLPLELKGRVLTVGMVNPFHGGAQADVRRVLSGADLAIVGISVDEFNETLIRLKLDTGQSVAKKGEAIAADQIQFDQADAEREADKGVRVIGDEVINLANKIVAGGVERGASDIHIESDTTGIRVRYRVQGTLFDWDQFIAPSFGKGLVARIKVLSGLDITEKRLPQDGRIGLRVGRREIDLRVSTLPASRGEKIVMRLFEAATMMRPLEQIFLEPNLLKHVRAVLNRPYGAIIVAGPTGSGKSSTLYAALHERKKNRPDTNIIMVEDPVEYRLSGVTQVQVNHAVGLEFSHVLRSMLRQDPDVIMVGEIRDEETARLALEASMTGHLLFSSLHANNAIAVVQRLENLGCNRTMIAQSLAMVMIQRLARKLCPQCVSHEEPPPVLLDSLAARGLADKSAPIPLPQAKGCAACNQTGYVGRVAVLESMRVTDEIANALMADVSLGEVAQLALKAGSLIPFSRYASYLMAKGVIGPSEALLTVAG